MEERHVELAPEGEREEIRQIFHAKGFRGDALDSAVDVITDMRQRWIENHDDRGAWPAAGQPLSGQGGGAFILCGAIPLLPFVAGAPASLLTSTLILSGRSATACRPHPGGERASRLS